MKPEPSREESEPEDGWFAEAVRQMFRTYGKPKIKRKGPLTRGWEKYDKDVENTP